MNIDPNAYCRHVGRSPAIVQAAKNNAYYIGRLQAHLDDFDKDLSEWKTSGEWKKDYKTWRLACEVALGISKRWADKLIKRYNDADAPKVGTTVPIEPDTDKAHELETLNSLPDPLSDFEPAPAAESKPAAPETPAPNANAAPAVEAKATEHPRDAIGFPIPRELMERWNQRQEVQDRITAASKLRCALQEIANKGHQNPLYGCYDWQGMIRTIGQLQFHLGQCKPEVVCYDCDGLFLAIKPTKGGSGITRHCHACDDRGFMTRKQWDDYADSKLEIVKETVNARLAKCKKNGG